MKIKCTLLLFLTIMLFSCKSTGFMMGKAKVTMLIDVSYPAKAETEDIDVYSTKKPAKDYVEFALIKCADTNNEWCIKQIKRNWSGWNNNHRCCRLRRDRSSNGKYHLHNFKYTVWTKRSSH